MREPRRTALTTTNAAATARPPTRQSGRRRCSFQVYDAMSADNRDFFVNSCSHRLAKPYAPEERPYPCVETDEASACMVCLDCEGQLRDYPGLAKVGEKKQLFKFCVESTGAIVRGHTRRCTAAAAAPLPCGTYLLMRTAARIARAATTIHRLTLVACIPYYSHAATRGYCETWRGCDQAEARRHHHQPDARRARARGLLRPTSSAVCLATAAGPPLATCRAARGSVRRWPSPRTLCSCLCC